MIITVVCDVLGEENNGTAVATMNLIRALKGFGHTVRILCADQFRKGEENVFVCPNLNLGKLLNAYVKKIGVTLPKTDKEIVRQAVEGADHVHLMLPFALSRAALKVAKEKGISVTAGFHMQAENLTSYIKLNKVKLANKIVYKNIYNHVYSMVDRIHYPTKFIQDQFEKSIKKSTPGVVISNGVHSYVKKMEVAKPEEFKARIVILSIGRYSREKSQDTLIKAVKYSKYKDKIQLIFAGRGQKEKYYKKLAKKLPVQPVFDIFPREEIVRMINYADFYVHPADIELEGIACLEGICCGKLTIVSDSPLSATKEFAIDDKCIFRRRKPKDLARVIDYWIEHPEEKKEYEELYLMNAKNYNQDECMKKMEKMITEVVNENRQKK